MLLNVGEVLCGGMRLSVYVIGTPCAVNGWTCAVSLARLSRVRRGRSARSVGSLSLGMVASYHTIHLLSTTNLRNAENSFSACHTSTQPPAAPVRSARARPPVLPWHDPPFAALRRVIFCANMTRGMVYTLTAADVTNTGAVITFQSVSLFQPPTKGPENTHKHCVFLTCPYNATSCS